MPSRLGHGLYKKNVALKNIFHCIYQSARRGHVFHTLSYLYRKYIVYFGCQAMVTYVPRANALRERQTYTHS